MHSLFKPIVAVLCLIFALCFAAPNAHADSFTDGTINFMVTSGSPAPTGSFVFDNTTSLFTSFTVDWDGAVYNIASLFPSLAPIATSGSWCASAPADVTHSCPHTGGFVLNNIDVLATTPTFTDGLAVANGTYTVTETAVGTPEPSSLALMLSGVGLVFGMRKRSSGLQLAS